jgi:cell shape-determining protein MreD
MGVGLAVTATSSDFSSLVINQVLSGVILNLVLIHLLDVRFTTGVAVDQPGGGL